MGNMIFSITAIVIAIIAIAFVALAHYCFDDNDVDMDWHNSENGTNCPHSEKTDVVVECTVTCEEVWTYCDACGKILKKRLDCV